VALAPIVIRHDRDDARYRELAEHYPAVCDVGAGGVGVLIAPRWVLTAGHVARGVTPFSAAVGFGGRGRAEDGPVARVDAAIPHPKFRESPEGIEHDIGLLRLAEPVEGIEPVPLFAGAPTPGLAVVLVGCGDTGDGQRGARGDGERGASGLWRAATNTVLRVEGDRLVFRFDSPGEGATDLEGFWAGGDSGCPAFADVDGEPRVVAVSSHGFDPRGDGIPANYGEHDVSFRVDAHAQWIADTQAAWADRPGNLPDPAEIRDGAPPADEPRGALVARWLELLAAGPGEERASFERTACTQPEGPAPPAAERRWLAGQLPGPLALEPAAWTELSGGALCLRAQSPAIDEDLVLTFEFAGTGEPRLVRVRLGLARD